MPKLIGLLLIFLCIPIASDAQTLGVQAPTSSANPSVNKTLAQLPPSADSSPPTINKTAVPQWRQAIERGAYDEAVHLAEDTVGNNALKTLLREARAQSLWNEPRWHAFLHYQQTVARRWQSQVDAVHFFQSAHGKSDPRAELEATLAALFATVAKAPLRLSAYCRFVARRFWLEEQLTRFTDLVPGQACPEYQRYIEFLQADSLTLVFPAAHPNSPSSAFGHTLLRIDKKDQRHESRLLNMSINFAAEVPETASGAAYAIKGLTGGFMGRYRLLPYHIKLREYGQIENRDTWEYPLTLSPDAVEWVLRHAYEMLVAHFDYYFFSENCSYHLLSLLDVAHPQEPLTREFDLWTIPVDTIRVLRDRGLVDQVHFTGSSVRRLRARRQAMSDSDAQLSLLGYERGLSAMDEVMNDLPLARQAAVLDLLSDYERYERLKSNPGAQGVNERERAVLSHRSRLGVRSYPPEVTPPATSPDAGHGSSRIAVRYYQRQALSDLIEVQFRPAYHDFRDPSAAHGDRASIELGAVGIALDQDRNKAFLHRLTLVSIESIEPRGLFFKPISWHTTLQWQRDEPEARHRLTFNVGAGVAYQHSTRSPVWFLLGESDLVDAPSYRRRQQWQLGLSTGTHWEPIDGLRMGFELDYRHSVNSDHSLASAEAWFGFAIRRHLSINLQGRIGRESDNEARSQIMAGLRFYL